MHKYKSNKQVAKSEEECAYKTMRIINSKNRKHKE